jgi:simple sugar transport system permease protein
VPVQVPAFAQLGVATVAKIPVIFLLMCAVYLAVGFMLRKTRMGRRMYLYGENNVALRFTGARNERMVILTYVLIGLIVGLAAMIMVSRVNSARIGFGESYLLQAILVVVLAGFDPYGGRGRATSLILGLVLLQSLQSAFTIMRFDPYMKTFIWGAALLLIMVINHVLNLRGGRRKVRDGGPSTPVPVSSTPDLVGSGAAR